MSLTRGAISAILRGERVFEPIVKIVRLLPLPFKSNNSLRYRVGITDGEVTNDHATLGSQLTPMVDDNTLQVNSLVRLKQYALSHSQMGGPIIGIMSVEVIPSGNSGFMSPNKNEVFEDCVMIPESPQHYPAQSTFTPTNQLFQDIVMSTPPRSSRPPYNENMETTPGGTQTQKIFPIASLNPYQGRWTIRGRCTQKSQVRTWSNAKGEGKLFSFTLADESCEVRVTAFKNEVDKFFDLVQVNKVYCLTKGSIKPANKQFNPTSFDYEITLGPDSQLTMCNELDEESAHAIASLPSMHFDFKTISQLNEVDTTQLVDVVGVVHECGPITEIMSKTTNKAMRKRDISLVDHTESLVRLTLWGAEADQFEEHANDHPVVVVKAARVSDFNGRSLSAVGSSTIIVNPSDIPEAARLRGWYMTVGHTANFTQFRGDGGGVSGAGGLAAWKTLADLKSGGIGCQDRPDYLTVKAYVVHVKKENCLYRACPSENCNKKLIDQGNGFLRCEKCSKDTTTYKWRLLLQLRIADMCDSQFVSCFQEHGEIVLGQTAENLGGLQEFNNESALDAALTAPIFQQFVFRLRAKMETYNDENRLKVVVVDAKKVDYVVYSDSLLARVDDLLKESPSI